MTENEIIEESNLQQFTKAQASKDGRVILKKISKITGLPSEAVHRLKECWLRRGNGWGKDRVTLDRTEQPSDPLTVLFSKLIQVVNDHYSAGIVMDLAPYFRDLENHGIKITVENNSSYATEVHDLIVNLSSYGKVVKDCEETIKDLGIEAEQIQFAPKSKFSSISSLIFKKTKGKDISDACQSRIEEALLTENAFTKIQSLSVEE